MQKQFKLKPMAILGILLFTAFVSYEISKSNEYVSPGALFVLITIIEYILYYFFLQEFKVINDRQFFYSARRAAAYPNFFNQTEGLRWSSSSEIKRNMHQDKDLMLDKFKFDMGVKNKFKIISGKKWFENYWCSIEPEDLTRSSIVFGQMGAGKTEFYRSVIAQEQFDRYLIHDSKGDYVERFARPKDIIVNPYDARGKVWDIFEEAKESPFVAEIFMTNLFNALAGEKKDFFNASAKERYMKLFNQILYKKASLSSADKFELFIFEVQKYIQAAEKSGRASEADIASTMKITLEFFEYMNFCIKKGVETFTIMEFLGTKNKMFLLSQDDQKTRLNPFFTGFLAAFVSIFLSQKDQKKSLTLFALDEYLTFAQNMDEETLEGLHTRVRSKGGCLMPGIQYLPENHKSNIGQKIINSAAYFFIFEGIDNYTLEVINKIIGKARYTKSSKNEQYKENIQSVQDDLLNTSIIKSLANRYEHITYIPRHKILYKGYTPAVQIIARNEKYVPSGLIRDFYREKR